MKHLILGIEVEAAAAGDAAYAIRHSVSDAAAAAAAAVRSAGESVQKQAAAAGAATAIAVRKSGGSLKSQHQFFALSYNALLQYGSGSMNVGTQGLREAKLAWVIWLKHQKIIAKVSAHNKRSTQKKAQAPAAGLLGGGY